jgi:hypothetical protein
MMGKAKKQKPKPLAFRIELIRLILKYATRQTGVDGPFHIQGTYVLHSLPQEHFSVFRSIDLNGNVLKAKIAKRSMLFGRYVGLKLSDVKFWIEKIKHYAEQQKSTGTSQSGKPE